MFLWFICLTVTQTTNVNQCTVLFGVQWPMAVLGPTDIQCPMSGSTGSSGCAVSYVKQYWVQWMSSVLCQAVLGSVVVLCPMACTFGAIGCPCPVVPCPVVLDPLAVQCSILCRLIPHILY